MVSVLDAAGPPQGSNRLSELREGCELLLGKKTQLLENTGFLIYISYSPNVEWEDQIHRSVKSQAGWNKFLFNSTV